jgi:Ca-activated chloride channel family protein
MTRPRARVPVLAAALLLLAAVPAWAAGSVRFLSPASRRPALGPTRVALQVTPPDGATVVRVALEVDGGAAGTLTAPPFTTTLDVGDGQRDRTLSATAWFSDGSQASAAVVVAAVRIQFTADVSLVSFYATVRDGSGRFVTGLTPEEFRLTENGRPQRIERLSTERRPLSVALVLDTSESMNAEDRIGKARAAAIRFLEALAPDDRAMVVAFSDDAHVVQPMTSERDALRAAVDGLSAKGGTALYDALWKAADLLGREEGRKVLVLLSDGKDEAQSGIEPGSLHTMDEAMQQALRNEVMLYAIGIGDFGSERSPVLDFYGRMAVRDILTTLAQATGGDVLFLSRPRQLAEAFERVAEALRNQYAIAYTSDDPRKNGTWRETRLAVDRPGLKVTARRGYYAPREAPAHAGG